MSVFIFSQCSINASIPFRKSASLQYEKTTIYVPATVGVSQQADNSKQVEETAALLARLFGGSTSTPAVGYWLSPAAGLVAEKTTVTLLLNRTHIFNFALFNILFASVITSS